ncbi:hypothetical protein KAR52_03635 [Candidatus Pacearchaeota archaeon]|nr:hypothetical protein [Candidatus Pacearchaeota archaeon]
MKISEQKIEKISEQILATLYFISPKSLFTSYIAKEIARDEEFTKNILLRLKDKKLVIEIKKNPQGVPYIRRSRWSLTSAIYNTYKQYQSS